MTQEVGLHKDKKDAFHVTPTGSCVSPEKGLEKTRHSFFGVSLLHASRTIFLSFRYVYESPRTGRKDKKEAIVCGKRSVGER